MSAAAPWVSVVIPALNERDAIVDALRCTQQEGVERIVVDGGSIDGTVESAHLHQAERVVCCAPGRGRQMEAGVREASGEVIVFLHADTRLQTGWLPALQEVMRDPGVAGGAFGLRFASGRFIFRLIELGARLRTRLGGLPYGDQALFVRRELLESRDWIPAVPMFEDLDLARLIRASGRLVLLPERAETSPRRYEANGVLRTWIRNLLALIGYLLHLDRARLRRWYERWPER